MQEPYFEAGLKILQEHGPGGLKLGALCRELGVTTGGFYYYFTNLADYIEGLLDHWFAAWAERMVVLARDEDDPIARFGILMAESAKLPYGTEAAIRQWAMSDPKVASYLERADDARMAVVRDTLGEMGFDHEVSTRLAEAALYLLIGHEFRSAEKRDPANFRWGLEVFLDYIERNRPR